MKMSRYEQRKREDGEYARRAHGGSSVVGDTATRRSDMYDFQRSETS